MNGTQAEKIERERVIQNLTTDTDPKPYKAVDVFQWAVGTGPITVFLLLISEKSRYLLSRPG